MRRLMLAVIWLGAVPLMAKTAKPVSADTPTRVTANVQGLTMTVQLPGHSFPRGALIRATISMRNTSRHVLYLDAHSLDAIVTDPSGNVRSDAAFLLPDILHFPAGGPGPQIRPFPPGAQVSIRPYLILRGNTVMATVLTAFDLHTPPEPAVGPKVRVHLTWEPRPSLGITVGSPLKARVVSPVPVRGPLHYWEWFVCVGTFRGQHGEVETGAAGTSRSAVLTARVPGLGYTSKPPCRGRREWSAVAGWLGHSVVNFIYRDPA